MALRNILNALGTLVKERHSAYQFLQFRTHDLQALHGSVQPLELEFLQRLVEEANELSGPIIEVGTLFGFTTQQIATWKSPDKELVTIDNFRWNPIGLSPQAHEVFTQRNLHYLLEKGNTHIHGDSNTSYYNAYSGTPPAMIFIDAGHAYEDVIVDLKWARDAGVQLITGHDYSPACPGVMKAVDEYFGGHIEVVETLWAYRPASES